MEKGLLFVVSAPAGCGKDTILEQLFKVTENVGYSVSATSRAPREGEVDGVHYHFRTREQFEQMIKNEEANLIVIWGCSSAGRALASHVRGQGFESPHLHQTTNMSEWLNRAVRTALLSHLLYSFHPMTPSWHAINPVTNNVAAQEFREYQRHPSGSSSQPFRRTYPR